LRGVIETWHIVLFSLVLGIAIAFEIPARQSMLIELVGRDALPTRLRSSQPDSIYRESRSCSRRTRSSDLPRMGKRIFSSTPSVS